VHRSFHWENSLLLKRQTLLLPVSLVNLICILTMQKKLWKSHMNKTSRILRATNFLNWDVKFTIYHTPAMSIVLRQVSTWVVGKDQLLMGPVSLTSLKKHPAVITRILVSLKRDGLNSHPACHSSPATLWRSDIASQSSAML